MTPPLYSIVVPLYNTAQYLPALLTSLENQSGRGDEYELELLFVDDSSPDEAGALAQAWLDRTTIRGAVVRQANAGVSAARNRGLDMATGAWIAFIDSDDFVSTGYVLGVHRFLMASGGAAEGIALVSCNVARYFEADDGYDHAHPLRDKFNRGDRRFKLDEHPEFIQSQAASAFFPLDRLRASGTRFLEGLHAAEDAIFVASYLVTQRRPEIATVAESDYYYRQRRRRDSAVDQFAANPDFYFARFSRGYLPLMRRAERELGAVPRWLGQYFLYDMRWFFPREMDPVKKATHLDDAEKARVLELVSAVLDYIDSSWVREYSITGMSLELRDLLLTLMGAPLLSAGVVEVHGIDIPRNLVQLRYRFAGALPNEAVTVGGRFAVIRGEKTRQLDYLGQTALKQRILWVEADDDLSVALNGREQQIRPANQDQTAFAITRARLGFDAFENPVGPPPPAKAARPLLRRLAGRARREAAAWLPWMVRDVRLKSLGEQLSRPRRYAAARIQAQRPGARSRFVGAWLFIDSVSRAGDNSEALFRHVQSVAPAVNAIFVIDRKSAEWARLKAMGAQLLAYGSVDHLAALQHAQFVISSGLGAQDAAPMPEAEYWGGQRPWRFVLLPNVLTLHERLNWLERDAISLVAVRDALEERRLTADLTTTPLTSLQVSATGLARHDELVTLGGMQAWGGRRTVVVALEAPAVALVELFRVPSVSTFTDRASLEVVVRPPEGASEPRDTPSGLPIRIATIHEPWPALLASALVCITDSAMTAFDAAAAGAAVVFVGDEEIGLPGAWAGSWRDALRMFEQLVVDAQNGAVNPQAEPARAALGLDGQSSSRAYDAVIALG